MKQRQISKFTGHVTLLVTGENPELFFQHCLKHGMVIWNMKKISATSCQGTIKLRDIHIIKKVNRKTSYKLSFIDKKGCPFVVKRFMRKKELLLACIMSILLVFFLSNILWKVTITGVTKEMEEKISEQLISYGVNKGNWLFNLEPPRSIQQRLIKDVPELLWIGVQQTGTTIHLEGVEKTSVKKEPEPGPRHLIAAKKGVIQKVFVEKGQPKVHVNDVVSPGDMLVSGILNDDAESEMSEEERPKQDIVAAEANVIAKTWYEATVNIPLTAKQEILTGEQEKRYYIGMGSLQIPVWNFKSPSYEEKHQEMNEKPLYFFKWKLPIRMIESILSEKVYNKVERTKEETIEIGIRQAKHDLKLELGPKAQILSEDILHETIENGKVRLRLYFTAEEDISKVEPITQGD